MPTKNGIHYLDSRLLQDPVKVVVIGAGGSGSHMVADLATLHQSMVDLGHPGGLDVTVMDFDTVSPANTGGRSRFFPCDVGANKAQTIVMRVNAAYGLEFKAVSQRLREDDNNWMVTNADLVIGCVDTRESRRSIFGQLASRSRRGDSCYYLDLGNGDVDGQVVLGEVGGEGVRLPCVTELYPEMLDPAHDPKDDGPSCSRAEALARQSAFVNKAASMHAVTMLSMLFRYGQIDHHAVFFSLRTGRSTVLGCDEQAWAQRFGFDPTKKATAGAGKKSAAKVEEAAQPA